MKRITVLTTLFVLLLAGSAKAQNRIWVGNLTKIRLIAEAGKDPAIEVELTEDETDGRFGKYDLQKTIVWSPLEKPATGVRIQLDGTFPAKLERFTSVGKGLVKSVSVSKTRNSVQIPDLNTTISGKQFEHSLIIVKTTKAALVNTRVVRNLGDQIITLRFTITEHKEVSNSLLLTNSLEFSTESFDRPATKPLISPFSQRQQQYIRKNLEALYKAPQDDYVTAVYPARYADPNILANMTRGRLSALGRLDVDALRAKLVITDRVRFVRNAVETLLTLDRRPPQVTIVAQILEVNRGTGTKMGVDFNYLGSAKSGGSGSFNSSGILGQDAILSGVYHNFSKSALTRFSADVNLLLERKHARLTAQPVIRVVNNSRGTFNSGEQLPFFIPTSDSSLLQDRTTENSNDFARLPAPGIADSQILEEKRKTKDRFTFKEGRRNRSIRMIRVGTRLVITPSMRNSDDVLLSINASYSEVTGYAQPHGNPILAERSVDTRVRVRHGETVVLAGLYRNVELKQMNGVPVLSDIPGLGKLFQSERKSKETHDIVFILTTFIQR